MARIQQDSDPVAEEEPVIQALRWANHPEMKWWVFLSSVLSLFEFIPENNEAVVKNVKQQLQSVRVV